MKAGSGACYINHEVTLIMMITSEFHSLSVSSYFCLLLICRSETSMEEQKPDVHDASYVPSEDEPSSESEWSESETDRCA